jgi:hypothetical protein
LGKVARSAAPGVSERLFSARTSQVDQMFIQQVDHGDNSAFRREPSRLCVVIRPTPPAAIEPPRWAVTTGY